LEDVPVDRAQVRDVELALNGLRQKLTQSHGGKVSGKLHQLGRIHYVELVL
jgi:hypothetical protein